MERKEESREVKQAKLNAWDQGFVVIWKGPQVQWTQFTRRSVEGNRQTKIKSTDLIFSQIDEDYIDRILTVICTEETGGEIQDDEAYSGPG